MKDYRTVWLDNEKVDVLENKAISSSVLGIAGYFDWHHTHADDCLVTDPETGNPLSASQIFPNHSMT